MKSWASGGLNPQCGPIFLLLKASTVAPVPGPRSAFLSLVVLVLWFSLVDVECLDAL